MAYIVKPKWETNSAFDHAWQAAHDNYGTAPNEQDWIPYYFETFLKVKLLENDSFYHAAEFENEAAYMLFLLEWS